MITEDNDTEYCLLVICKLYDKRFLLPIYEFLKTILKN